MSRCTARVVDKESGHSTLLPAAFVVYTTTFDYVWHGALFRRVEVPIARLVQVEAICGNEVAGVQLLKRGVQPVPCWEMMRSPGRTKTIEEFRIDEQLVHQAKHLGIDVWS